MGVTHGPNWDSKYKDLKDLSEFHKNAAKLQLMMGHKTSVPTTATYRVSELQKGLA